MEQDKYEGIWTGPFLAEGTTVYQYVLSNNGKSLSLSAPDALLGYVKQVEGSSGYWRPHYVGPYTDTASQAQPDLVQAMNWVEDEIARLRGIQPAQGQLVVRPAAAAADDDDDEAVPSGKTALQLILDFMDTWHGDSRHWEQALHNDVQHLVRDIEALISPPGEPATSTEADEVLSHQNITEFTSEVHWIDENESMGQIEMWLPEEPFGHISQSSIRALSEGVTVTVLDMPTVDGIAVDSIVIEPKIKPIYGQRAKRGLYVVDSEEAMRE